MRGATTCSSGATVECDRNFFRVASTLSLKTINVARAEGASEIVLRFFRTLEAISVIAGASAVGASEYFVDFANGRLCVHQKLGGGMTGTKAKLGGHDPLCPSVATPQGDNLCFSFYGRWLHSSCEHYM